MPLENISTAMEAVSAAAETTAAATVAPFDLIMSVIGLLGGLALFLYGMSLMSNGLEKRAGNQLKQILFKLTSSPMRGLMLGLLVTAARLRVHYSDCSVPRCGIGSVLR